MPNVLTTDSTISCGHAGNVAVTSSAKLRINEKSVLIKKDVNGKTVNNCTTVPASDGSGTTTADPCKTVSLVTTGEAIKLTVESEPVMVDTLAGTTDGMVNKVTPQTLLSATANQNKLKTI